MENHIIHLKLKTTPAPLISNLPVLHIMIPNTFEKKTPAMTALRKTNTPMI